MATDLHEQFSDPPREFGLMPFWFWNDDCTGEEIVRQIREFHGKGFAGFIPHARVGLSRRVGYLTDEWFRLVRVATEEAARLGMKVVLYDEGSYPSGSAQGRVVAENPAHAARCLIALHTTITGPRKGFWRPNPGRAMTERLVCAVQGREAAPDTLDEGSLQVLEAGDHDVIGYDVPEGTWRLMAVWHVFSGGVIRGVFEEEDEVHASAPPAGDIMNPDAVACFLRHTHDQYDRHLHKFFGSTVVAMFTDEPNPLGRSARRGHDAKPYTDGFLDDVAARWDDDVRRWLPALWVDCGPRTEAFRHAYDRAVHDRVERVFYGAQSDWCASHGIALTGHPEKSNEMGALRRFHWPGQDMVWRWVVPGNPSALAGPNSVAPKAAASAAALAGQRRSTSEALGAYGWRLTLDEAKWLLDWHLVRGNNLFFPHAAFYSLRGRRAFESEPDIGLHNVWWTHLRLIGDHVRRLCWLLTDGVEVCDVAVLTDPNDMSWDAARELLTHQIDFLYVDDAALAGSSVRDGHLVIGGQQFRAVVCDPAAAAAGAESALRSFRSAGGLVIDAWEPDELVPRLGAALDTDVRWESGTGREGLRALHYRKAVQDFYLLVNEGEQVIDGELSLRATGALELWDPMDGTARPWPARIHDGRTRTSLRLERRQALVIAIDATGEPREDAVRQVVPGSVVGEVTGPWTAAREDGTEADVPCLGDWSRTPGWETFSGTLAYRTTLTVAPEWRGAPLFLDLCSVGDIADVSVNGQPVGVRAWAPHVFDIGPFCRPGENALEVRVTNSMANEFDGHQMPSGLMGPVVLREGCTP